MGEQSPERAGWQGAGLALGREEGGELLAGQLFLFERRHLRHWSRLRGQKAVTACALAPLAAALSLPL